MCSPSDISAWKMCFNSQSISKDDAKCRMQLLSDSMMEHGDIPL